MEREVELSTKSRVTVGLCIAVLTLTFWVGVAWAQISELQSKIGILREIDRRLSRIEGKLGVTPE